MDSWFEAVLYDFLKYTLAAARALYVANVPTQTDASMFRYDTVWTRLSAHHFFPPD